MACREFLLGLRRRASRSTAIVALVAICLLSGSALAWRRAAAKHIDLLSESSSGLPASVTNNLIAQEQSKDGLIGEFEGYFDAATRRIVIQPKTGNGTVKRLGRTVDGRNDPNAEVAQGSQFGFSVIASKFIATGDNPGTVSGEVQISNLTSATLYNTRIVFTSFKVGGPNGADAGNVPSATGFAYFNDGQIAYNDKLSVSRYYGDIPAGSNVRNIWTFATVAQPPSFFFAYKVLADIGVAAESVLPAAVQVGPTTGNTVQINGRGFNNPTVELLNGATVVAPLTVTASTATSITAMVPGGASPGIYSLRVTNTGGTAGGAGSSTLLRKLTVTGVPDATHTLTGTIAALGDTGPYLFSGNTTVAANRAILPGTVIYVSTGATISLQGSGNLIANGGVPGISSTSPAQIVITAQRSPGNALPTAGFWGGVIATSASTAEMVMKNVVVEFGGAAGRGQINISNSGRRLRFTDSISRASTGGGISALGATDSLVGFTRNRIENNGAGGSDAALAVSANAALGLYELPTGVPVATSVGDASYYYSSANEFINNQNNVVQIGTDADLASNDFNQPGSNVLVGQGTTPLRIRGNCANPAIVGAPAPTPAELTITATSKIELAPDLNFQAGDFATDLVGCIAANGYAGVYQGPEAVTSNKYIEFNKVPSVGNFGAIYFTRNAMANCILNYTKVQGGGAVSTCSPGGGEVVAEVVGVKVTNSQITGSASGGLAQIVGGRIDSRGTTTSGTTPIIETIAGGLAGDGNLGPQAVLSVPVAIASDPLGRGVFIVDSSDRARIRFLNTSRSTVTIATQKIQAGVIQTIAGGGDDAGENTPALNADLGITTGLAVNPTGDILYFIDTLGPAIRAVNISSSVKTIAGASVDPGKVATFATGGSAGFGAGLNALTVNPTNGDVYVADATAGQNKVFKVAANASSVTADALLVAGVTGGPTPKATDSFSQGPATSTSLLQPRALAFDTAGNLYIADTGRSRVIKVDTSGTAKLMVQFPQQRDSPLPADMPIYNNPPFPSGLTVLGNNLYIANGNAQNIAVVPLNAPTPSGAAPATVAGTVGASCDYTGTNLTCGDNDVIESAAFNLLGSTATIPLAGIASDGKGIYVLDQGGAQRGRIRYLNVSNMTVEVGSVRILAGFVNTIAGSGLSAPYDGGLATSASFSSPNGVTMDPNGNLWITEINSGKLRFVNLGTSPLTIFPGLTAEQTVTPGGIVTVNKDVGAGASDGVPVSQAGFENPQGLFATAEGIYIADSKGRPGTVGTGANARRTGLIRFINTGTAPVVFYSGSVSISVAPGEIKSIAGGGTDAPGVGDGAAPLAAVFRAPEDVVVRPNGDIYIADAGNFRVRKIARATGIVSTLMLSTANTNQYTGVGLDPAGRLLVANAATNSILREKTPNSGETVNGFDTILTGGELRRPRDVAADSAGNLYVTNPGEAAPPAGAVPDYRVLKITAGTATTFAGQSGKPGYSGDGGPATSALLNNLPDLLNIASGGGTAVFIRPTVNIIVTPGGDVIFADPRNNAIRRVR